LILLVSYQLVETSLNYQIIVLELYLVKVFIGLLPTFPVNESGE